MFHLPINVYVAPFAGARVETQELAVDTRADEVAPFAGARVETDAFRTIKASSYSVAPFAGARVETDDRLGLLKAK